MFFANQSPLGVVAVSLIFAMVAPVQAALCEDAFRSPSRLEVGGEPSHAGAVPSAREQSMDLVRYEDLLDEAVTEYLERHYEEARTLFAEAHRMAPSARTHRGLGMVEFDLRNYPASIGQLEAALQSEVKPLTGELRARTEQLLARARGFVATLTIDVRFSRESDRFLPTQVKIDGVPSKAAPGAPIVLRVGEHEVEVIAPGYRSEKRVLNLHGGDRTRLAVPLQRADDGPRDESSRWYKSPWLWTIVGVAVAGAATGTAIALTKVPTDEGYGGTTGQKLTGP